MKRTIVYFFIILLFLVAANFQLVIYSQTKPIRTLSEILSSSTHPEVPPLKLEQIVRSLNIREDKKTKLSKMIEDVRRLKVNFMLTKENETYLASLGANDELIRVIRENYSPESPVATIAKTVSTKVEAIYLPKPIYPNVSDVHGEVIVKIEIDEKGSVISAKAISGHRLLVKSAEDAALLANFRPATVGGKPVKSSLSLSYKFSPADQLTEIKNSIGMEFVFIPKGAFRMGSPLSEGSRKNDEGEHQVTIGKNFYMGKYEVTQEQWKAVMGNSPSDFKNCPTCPVDSVSWNDTQEFIRKLNEKRDGREYRLPSEAEWEYAARGGTTTKWSFTNNENDLEKFSWYKRNSEKRTHPVGEKFPNAFGLYDMHGNVSEWCEDPYGEYSMLGEIVPDNSSRVFRGGSWDDDPALLRSANRYPSEPSRLDKRIGFRLLVK